jgi:hypothetical protein
MGADLTGQHSAARRNPAGFCTSVDCLYDTVIYKLSVGSTINPLLIRKNRYTKLSKTASSLYDYLHS